jgi:hypothetical protein
VVPVDEVEAVRCNLISVWISDSVKAGDSGGSGEDDNGVELPAAIVPNRSDQRDVRERVRSRRTSSFVPPTPLHLLYAQRDKGPQP